MEIILISIIIYVLSCYLVWLHTHISYSKGGVLDNLDINKVEGVDILIYTFLPVVNTFYVLICWIFFYPKEKTNSDYIVRFFKIKK
jgi:magnesium-transporting ATPase (P-type)